MLPPRLLFAVVVVVSIGLATATTSSNDPFRAIAAHVQKKPDPPICCLKPQQHLEPLEDEILLSFEEWKQKQSVTQEKERAKEREAANRSAHTTDRGGDHGVGDTSVLSQENAAGTGEQGDNDELARAPVTEPLPPHFRVPLTDRFNYASLECSARVHLAHRSAKSTSSILSSKRDRYMLSPCRPPNGERQFVVVELCEDIRIDTVQLANFEFFSGIFKDFRIGVAKTHVTKEDEWTDVGLFRAKNVRGVQSFHPPTSLGDFYRFIRIEFLSHYGNEYYCPVSLLRVYGLTHLEQWKWEMWEQESRAKVDSAVTSESLTQADPVGNSVIGAKPINDTNTTGTNATVDIDSKAKSDSPVESNTTQAQSPIGVPLDERPSNQDIPLSPLMISPPTATMEPYIHQESVSEPLATVPPPLPSIPNAKDVYNGSPSVSPLPSATPSPVEVGNAPPTSDISSLSTTPHVLPSSAHSGLSKDDGDGVSTAPVVEVEVDSSVSSQIGKATATTINVTVPKMTDITSTSKGNTVHPSPHASVPSGGGGESIYRTIMNRLTALEANHTLYTRYVEQQMSGVREVLRRLGEDVGRLEGIGKAQSQMYQRTVRDWEKGQQQLQTDYHELMARVDYLSDEIVLEKRLGIAQLCLLLTVLVFMGLTRGSRGDAPQPISINRSLSVKEWGKRHLKFSGDWTTRFRGRGREVGNPHPQAARPVSEDLDLHQDMKSEFLSKEEDITMPLRPLTNTTIPIAMSAARSISSDARGRHGRNRNRSHTPSLRTRQHPQYHPHPEQHVLRPPATPTSHVYPYRPRLQRSNSQTYPGIPFGAASGSGSAHRSARKWARTAHLHEVRGVDRKRVRIERERDMLDENGIIAPSLGVRDDPFWVGNTGVRNRDNFGGKSKKECDNGEGEYMNEHGRARPVTSKPHVESEVDVWVDTDTEESEAGTLDWKLDTGAGRSPLVLAYAGNEH